MLARFASKLSSLLARVIVRYHVSVDIAMLPSTRHAVPRFAPQNEFSDLRATMRDITVKRLRRRAAPTPTLLRRYLSCHQWPVTTH
jgi:hypothetical protein